jgi:hypothetical protein
MAGLFPSIANTQNVDINGQPLAASVLTVYNGGTLVLASCFQDIGLAIPVQNPMTADETGRLPIFYVNDGVYRVRLVDQFGTLIYDYPQVSSIGASSSGGGGSGVDPTTIFQTGDELFQKIAGIRAGWVRQNARTLGSATSGASERANNDAQNLFLFIWANYPDSKCPVVGGRGVSAAADWAANKQITLPDMRGKTPFGLDGMGNGRANVIPDANVQGGDTGDTADALVGTTTHIVGQVNLPAIKPALTIVDLGHTHPILQRDLGDIGQSAQIGGAQPNVSAGPPGSSGTNNGNTQTAVTGVSAAFTNNLGSGTALETISPGALGTWYLKL